MTSNSVVLPAPFGPMSPTISFWLTSKLTSSSTWRPPKRREMLSTAKYARSGIGAHRLVGAAQRSLELGGFVPGGGRFGRWWGGCPLLLRRCPCHPFAGVEGAQEARPETGHPVGGVGDAPYGEERPQDGRADV